MQVGIILAAQQKYITVLQSRGINLVASVRDVWIKLYSVMLFMNLRYQMKSRVLHYFVLSDASISAEKGQQHHDKKHSKGNKGHVSSYNSTTTNDKQRNNLVLNVNQF